MAATKVAISMTSSLAPVPTDDLSQPLLKKSDTILAPSASELPSAIRSTKEERISIASDKSDAASTTIHVKSDLTTIFNQEKCATQETTTFACVSKRGCWEELIDANAGKNNAMIELDFELWCQLIPWAYSERR
jgi:hypothetical protein